MIYVPLDPFRITTFVRFVEYDTGKYFGKVCMQDVPRYYHLFSFKLLNWSLNWYYMRFSFTVNIFRNVWYKAKRTTKETLMHMHKFYTNRVFFLLCLTFTEELKMKQSVTEAYIVSICNITHFPKKMETLFRCSYSSHIKL